MNQRILLTWGGPFNRWFVQSFTPDPCYAGSAITWVRDIKKALSFHSSALAVTAIMQFARARPDKVDEIEIDLAIANTAGDGIPSDLEGVLL